MNTTKQTINWQPNQSIDTPNRLAPEKEIHFFCDLHADAEAFLRSLKLSQLISMDSQLDHVVLTQKAQDAQVIIGGDCFDKGPSNLALFRLIGQLYRQQLDLIVLAGNHDIRIYAGLLALDNMDDLRQAHFFVRMGRKTAAFFAEVYHEYCQDEVELTVPESLIQNQLMPSEDWYLHFPNYAQHFMPTASIEKEIRQIQKKSVDFIDACHELGLSLKQVYQAAIKAKQLFVDPQGEFAWFFNRLDLIHLSGNYLFSHAGIDDIMSNKLVESSAEEINQHFRQQLDQGLIFQMYYSEYGNVFRTKYRNKDWPLTSIGTGKLKALGIHAIVNGHRSHKTGQQLFVRQGLLNFECDTQLNTNCRRKNNNPVPGEAVTIFYPDGKVSALCSDIEPIKMFHPTNICA